ncbi:MAG TPA: dihydrofolate reductase family protein [Rubrobacter sp.]|nr:dihydrofolate reductase family protein [Rubrobacter sp.]
MSGKTLKLFPRPAGDQSGSTEEVYENLELPRSGPGGMSRPYVFINMVSSVDGNAAVEGKAAGIGTAADRYVMRTLRSKADAVMIGAGTLRAEKLSLGLDAEDAGPCPLAVILTATGDVPLESNLVRYGDQKILVLLADSADEAAGVRLARQAEVLRVQTDASGRVDLSSALELLSTQRGVDRLLVEGGPILNHALISENLADELFITLAPKLFGTSNADAPGVLGKLLDEPRDLHLLSAYLADDELFLRYALDTR